MKTSEKYNVILADPPWPYRVWSKNTGGGRTAESHYPTMSIEDICALPISDFAADNCALFLWCVWPSIFEYVPSILTAWGFTYKTNAFTWVKSKKSGFGFFMGMGHYTRANDEPCLLAIKGKMPVAAHDVLGIIYAPIRRHSQKPDEQYNKIEQLYPKANYLELFSRRARPGWDAWGNEIRNDVEISATDK